MRIELKEDENIDDLQCNNLKIIQNNKYFKYGVDAVFLANFVKTKTNKKNAKVVDFGAGTGIISILLTEKIQPSKIYAIEIQEKISNMAKRSVKLNNLENKIEVLNIDINEVEKHIERESIDIIVTNPPYQKCNAGVQNESEEKRISRHEIYCTIEDICEKAKYLLKDNGELYIVHRPERLVDVIVNLRKYNLEPKELRYIQSNEESAPVLFLVKAIKNAGSFLKTLKPLIIYDKNGNYTKEIDEIYGKEVKHNEN